VHDKYKRLWSEYMAKEWLESREERAKVTNKPFIVCECPSDPLDMIAHILREIASPFQVLQHENASRNQDAFTTFDFREFKLHFTIFADEGVSVMGRCTGTN
jgi:hypothetical protein